MGTMNLVRHAKWDRERVIGALRERRQAGRDLSTIHMRDNDSSLFYSAINYFGTYVEALRAAGIEPDSVRRLLKWSRERVIEQLHRRQEAGLEFTYKALRRSDVPLLHGMQSYFPTYRDALRAAGIDDEQVVGAARRKWTPQDILEALRQAHARGEDLSLRRFRAHQAKLVGAATGHFGSYAKAVAAAGISYAKICRARFWTDAQILSMLRRRHQAGKDLSTAGMSVQCASLLRSATFHFGTYRQAVERAGIDYVSVSRRVLEHWTRAQVLDGLRKMHDQGLGISEEQVAARNRKMASAASRLFGSYRKAIEALGLDYSEICRAHVRVWSRKRITQLLRELYRAGQDLRVSRVMKDVPGLASATCVYFGSYRNAILAAGLKYPPLRNPGPWTASRVVGALQERHAKGDDLRYSQLLESDESLVLAARHYFGTYEAAIEKAGFKYSSIRWQIIARERGISPRVPRPASLRQRRPRILVWPVDRILVELRQLHQAGEDLHCEAVKKKHVNLFAAAYRRFRSLHDALQAAGIPSTPNIHSHWNANLVVERIRAAFADGRPHHRDEMKAAHRGLWAAAEKHFGSWLAACHQAGINPALLHTPRRHWTRQLVLDQLREDHRLGKDLSGFRLNKDDPALSGAMIRLFGSHRKALEAAGIDPNKIGHHGPPQTAEDVLNSLRQAAQAAGAGVLSFAVVRRADPNLPRRAHYRFGSLKAAVDAAGLEFEYRLAGRSSDMGHWTEKTVLRTLVDLHASSSDLRHRIVKQKNQSLFFAAKKLFGSYSNAVQQAGINYWTMSQERMSQEQATKERAEKQASSQSADPPEPTGAADRAESSPLHGVDLRRAEHVLAPR
jgi:hypothetical protein